MKIKLHCVITGGNSFNIEIDKLVHFNALDVIKVNEGKEINENSNRASEKTKDLSIIVAMILDDARNLNEEEGICPTISIFFILILHQYLSIDMNFAHRVIAIGNIRIKLAIFLQHIFNVLFVHL
jgi:hypothetical protein